MNGFDELTIRDFLTSIAANTPTPGGGAVASIAAALAAALAQMVINFSVGKKSLAEHDSLHLQSLRRLGELSTRAIELADADSRAYARLNELWKLKKTDEVRRREFPNAVTAAIHAPQQVVQTVREMLDLMRNLIGTTSSLLNSDLAIAAILAEAAVRAAAWNILANLPLVEDASQRQTLGSLLVCDINDVKSTCAMIEQSCHRSQELPKKNG